MHTFPMYRIPTVGIDPGTPDPSAFDQQRVKAIWDAASVVFFGAVGAVLGGIAIPQFAGEYFDWMGGAVIGGLVFAGVTWSMQSK